MAEPLLHDIIQKRLIIFGSGERCNGWSDRNDIKNLSKQSS